MGLVLGTLSSCSRATYVFSPGPHAYLATEQPAPSVPMPAVPPAAARADSLPAAASPRSPGSALQQRGNKRRPPVARLAGGRRLAWPRFLATKLVAKRLDKLAATRPRPHNAAHHAGTTGASGTLVAALCLLGIGLLGVLIGAGISTNLIGALFGVFLMALGSVAIVVGLVLLLVALVTNE
ncbi:MAG: hypothetical protein ACRYF0_05070 [Janthinobacterium lividum]